MRVADDMQAALAHIDRIAAGPADLSEFGSLVRTAVAKREEPRPPAATRSATIDALIAKTASDLAVDPALVRAVAETESGLDPLATSPSGARGLMQLMPSTAQSLGVVDAYDPADNLRGGVRYLRDMLSRFGNLDLAIAAYNAGPAAVSRFEGIPPYPETQAYVRRVVARYRELSNRRGPILNAATLR